jgi:hypothetical protein
MSHCHDEHRGNDGHSHDEHDHSDDISPALQHSLYKYINFEGVSTLNETAVNSGLGIVKKTWPERLDPEPVLESDTDEQLILHVP